MYGRDIRRDKTRLVQLDPSAFDRDYHRFCDYISLGEENEDKEIMRRFPAEIDFFINSNKAYNEFVGYFVDFVRSMQTAKYGYESENRLVTADFYHLAILIPENSRAMSVIFDLFYVLAGHRFMIEEDRRNKYIPSYEELMMEDDFLNNAVPFYMLKNNIVLDVTDNSVISELNGRAREFSRLRDMIVKLSDEVANSNNRSFQRNNNTKQRGFSGGNKMKNNNNGQGEYARVVSNFSRETREERSVSPRVTAQSAPRTNAAEQRPQQSATPAVRDIRAERQRTVAAPAPTAAKITVLETEKEDGGIDPKTLKLLSTLTDVGENGIAPLTLENYSKLRGTGLLHYCPIWNVGKKFPAFDLNTLEQIMIDPKLLALPAEDLLRIPGASRSVFATKCNNAPKSNDICPELHNELKMLDFSKEVYVGMIDNAEKDEIVIFPKQNSCILINKGNPNFENDLRALEYLNVLYKSNEKEKLLLLEEAMFSWYKNDDTTPIKISSYLFGLLNHNLTVAFNKAMTNAVGLSHIRIDSFINVELDEHKEVSNLLMHIRNFLGDYYCDILLSEDFFKMVINASFAGYGKMYEEQKEINSDNTENDDYSLFLDLSYSVIIPDTEKWVKLGDHSAIVENGKIVPFALAKSEVPNFYFLLNRIYLKFGNKIKDVYLNFATCDTPYVLSVTKSLCTQEYIGNTQLTICD